MLLPHEARLAVSTTPALTAASRSGSAHMYSRLGDQRRASGQRASRDRGRDRSRRRRHCSAKAHGLLALEGHWAGTAADGIAHGTRGRPACCRASRTALVARDGAFLLSHQPSARREISRRRSPRRHERRGRQRHRRSAPSDVCWFHGGWVEATRGNHDAAIASAGAASSRRPIASAARTRRCSSATRCSRRGNTKGLSALDPVVAELEGFGFPQWHALAATLTGECLRALGRSTRRHRRLRRVCRSRRGPVNLYAVGQSSSCGAHRAGSRLGRRRQRRLPPGVGDVRAKRSGVRSDTHAHRARPDENSGLRALLKTINVDDAAGTSAARAVAPAIAGQRGIRGLPGSRSSSPPLPRHQGDWEEAPCTKENPRGFPRGLRIMPAATYSPTQFPMQYHGRYQA